MENAAEKIFTELKEDISTYARLKLRLLKLMAIERTAIVLAVLSHSLILLLLSFFTVLFLFVALGCYLGELLDSPALGFLIVGGIYLLFTLIVWGMKDGIRIRLMNTVIEAFGQGVGELGTDHIPALEHIGAQLFLILGSDVLREFAQKGVYLHLLAKSSLIRLRGDVHVMVDIVFTDIGDGQLCFHTVAIL